MNSDIVGFINTTYDHFHQCPDEKKTTHFSKVDGVWKLVNGSCQEKVIEDEIIKDFVREVEFESDWFGGDSKSWVKTAKKLEFILSRSSSDDLGLKMALQMLERDPAQVVLNSDQFCANDPDKLFNLSLEVIKKKPSLVTGFINKFLPQTIERRTQLAFKLAECDSNFFPWHVERFLIDDQKTLYALAKIVVKNDPSILAETINKFKISSEDERFELASMIAPYIRNNIRHFHLDEEKRFKIALTNVQDAAVSIESYEFPEDKRFEIALKIVDVGDEKEILNVVRRFDLTDDHLYQLGLKIAEKKPEFFDENLSRFLVTDRDQLFDIASTILGSKKEFLGELNMTDADHLLFFIPFLARALRNGISVEQFEQHKVVIKNILLVRDKGLRDRIVNCFIAGKLLGKSPECYLQQLSIRSTPLQSIVRLMLTLFPFDPSTFLKRLYTKDMEDMSKERSLIQFILTVYEEVNLKNDQRGSLLEKIAAKPNFSQARQAMKMIEGILLLNGFDRLMQTDDFSKLIEELFKEFLGVKEIPQFAEKYERIDSFRKKDLLFTYAAMHKDNVVVSTFFKEFLMSILTGDFKEKRYNSDKSVHLQKVFSDKAIKEEWMKGESQPASSFKEAFVVQDQKPLPIRIKESLNLGHLPDIEEKYPQLFLFLNGGTVTPDQKNIESRVIEWLKGNGKGEVLDEWLQELSDSLFKNKLIDWLNPQKIDRNTFEKLVVLDSDDPQDIFLCGEGLGSSCQKITGGNPQHNQGLIGYLHNGYNRVVVVKNREGTLLGRALLRLYWDEKNKSAVLYQDSYYGNFQLKGLVDAMCKNKALKMNLPLTAADGDKPYQGSVGAWPKVLEYVDAVGGINQWPYVIGKKVFLV